MPLAWGPPILSVGKTGRSPRPLIIEGVVVEKKQPLQAGRRGAWKGRAARKAGERGDGRGERSDGRGEQGDGRGDSVLGDAIITKADFMP